MWFPGAVALLLSSLPRLVRSSAPDRVFLDYDAIIVGGGPAGLSCASGLARVSRNVLLLDSGEYRNGPTRHLHDLISFGGEAAVAAASAPPLLSLAAGPGESADGADADRSRGDAGILQMVGAEAHRAVPDRGHKNGTVTRVELVQNNTYFRVTFTLPSGIESTKTANKLVLGTGLRDLIPSTPELLDIWGKGAYWCPWCDGHEHKDQQLGFLMPLDRVASSASSMLTLNKDMIAFVNGTDTPEMRAAADKRFPQWQDFLKLHNIRIENRTITRFERLLNGSNDDADPSFATYPEHDLFTVHFDSGPSVDRNAFYASIRSVQASNIGVDAGVKLVDNKMQVNINGMRSNVPGIFAIGDANSDDSTNLPHALWSGKRAAVTVHGDIAKETRLMELAALGKQTATNLAKRAIDENVRKVWSRMNGRSDEMLHAGAFDQF